MGSDIFVREQGAIAFNVSNTLAIATPIDGDQTNGPSGSGGLDKLGAGTLSLNGANTYSGTTTVDAGTLNLNGSIAGDALVAAGSTLTGNATVSGNITNSGNLAPGNPIGTISTTNLVLNSSGQLEIDVAANGTNDLVAATGTAQLAGTLLVNLDPAAVAPGTYTILSASAITGTFGSVTFTGAIPAGYSLSYLPSGAPTYVQLNIAGPTAAVPMLDRWALLLLCGLIGVVGVRLLPSRWRTRAS